MAFPDQSNSKSISLAINFLFDTTDNQHCPHTSNQTTIHTILTTLHYTIHTAILYTQSHNIISVQSIIHTTLLVPVHAHVCERNSRNLVIFKLFTCVYNGKTIKSKNERACKKTLIRKKKQFPTHVHLLNFKPQRQRHGKVSKVYHCAR